MIKDGLTDVFNGYHMGITAENLAEQYQVTRDDQDAFAAASQNKADARPRRGPLQGRDRAGHGQDPQGRDDRRARRIYPRRRRAVDGARRPAPGLQEGRHRHRRQRLGPQRRRRRAVLMSREEAERRGAPILARVASWASAGVDPSIMGIGPVPALEAGAREGRLDDRRPRPDRGQRGLRRPGAGGRQGARLGRRQGQRQWRRDRHRPPDRRQRRPRAHHPALRDAAARRQEGPRHPVHRRRHGHRALRRALSSNGPSVSAESLFRTRPKRGDVAERLHSLNFR